jgi:hypothetical protein
MARVHPVEFTHVESAPNIPDCADVESGNGRGPPLTHGISGFERAFSVMSRADNALSFSRSFSASSAFSALSRADNFSFASLEGSEMEEDAAEQFSDDEDTDEPAAESCAQSSSQPTTPRGLVWKRVFSIRTQLRRLKMRARSKWRRRRRSRALFSPTALSKARIWLAAYVSLADSVSDIYSISVRPIKCIAFVQRRSRQCSKCQ